MFFKLGLLKETMSIEHQLAETGGVIDYYAFFMYVSMWQ